MRQLKPVNLIRWLVNLTSTEMSQSVSWLRMNHLEVIEMLCLATKWTYLVDNRSVRSMSQVSRLKKPVSLTNSVGWLDIQTARQQLVEFNLGWNRNSILNQLVNNSPGWVSISIYQVVELRIVILTFPLQNCFISSGDSFDPILLDRYNYLPL